MRTYYDILGVSRKAPLEVIKAAYKALTLKYHPDVNNSPEAKNKMAMINEAYSVLSDPIKRAEYDNKIAHLQLEENVAQQQKEILAWFLAEAMEMEIRKRQKFEKIRKIFRYSFYTFLAVLGIIGIIRIFFYNQDKPKPLLTGPQPVNILPTPEPPQVAYIRPPTDPLGNPWPTKASYLAGYKIGNSNGRSVITIDNTKNSSDVYVKLFSYDYTPPKAVRHFYIPAYSQFQLKKVKAGKYDIRYQDLDHGTFSKTESFRVKEQMTYYSDGSILSQASDIIITFYKVLDGNFHTYPIDSVQFRSN